MMKSTTQLLRCQDSSVEAIAASFRKLDPRVQLRNPVMFAVYLGSILTTIFWVNSLVSSSGESSGFVLGVTIWLWFTVLFANFAEAIAEGHGKAQAASLKKSRTTVVARKIADKTDRVAVEVPATDLRDRRHRDCQSRRNDSCRRRSDRRRRFGR